jgi:hypothetical protein
MYDSNNSICRLLFVVTLQCEMNRYYSSKSLMPLFRFLYQARLRNSNKYDRIYNRPILTHTKDGQHLFCKPQ